MGIHEKLNKEKQDILKEEGSMLVIANPGTGKTKLLAHKYLDLVLNRVPPEEILCLTFTRKAKGEMEQRIIELLEENNFEVDLGKLNIYTFHSYALDFIEENEIVTTDLLRFAVYEYLKENEVLSYSDSYLLETIVPKMENLIRYIKNYGILPKDIDAEKAKTFLKDFEKNGKIIAEKEDLKKFLDVFIKVFLKYENLKKGSDYTDILISFLNAKNFPEFKYVLVDELQDVNNLEADIALRSGKEFFAVGDKKQAIFGFQGGSIKNFTKFDGNEFTLSENFRSTNQILDYAKEIYTDKTADAGAAEELKDLRNSLGKKGPKPVIIDSSDKEKELLVELVKKLSEELKEKEQLGVIVRTNSQILQVSKVLEDAGIEFASTFKSSSKEARENIIKFLWAIFSNNVDIIKNALFTPYFPCGMQKAFELSENKDITAEELLKACPEFKALKEKIVNIEDVNFLFKETILPISFAYGEDYVQTAVKLQNVATEAIHSLQNISLQKFINYLKSCDLLGLDKPSSHKINLTTVHKAKGLQYTTAIYLPKKARDTSNFQDKVVEAILGQSKKRFIDDGESLNSIY